MKKYQIYKKEKNNNDNIMGIIIDSTSNIFLVLECNQRVQSCEMSYLTKSQRNEQKQKQVHVLVFCLKIWKKEIFCLTAENRNSTWTKKKKERNQSLHHMSRSVLGNRVLANDLELIAQAQHR